MICTRWSFATPKDLNVLLIWFVKLSCIIYCTISTLIISPFLYYSISLRPWFIFLFPLILTKHFFQSSPSLSITLFYSISVFFIFASLILVWFVLTLRLHSGAYLGNLLFWESLLLVWWSWESCSSLPLNIDYSRLEENLATVSKAVLFHSRCAQPCMNGLLCHDIVHIYDWNLMKRSKQTTWNSTGFSFEYR